MNGRVLLLVVVTGLFMAAWNGDQAAMEAALAKRAELQAQNIAKRKNAATHQNVDEREQSKVHKLASVSKPVLSTAGQDAVPKTVSVSVTVNVPLPRGITAGIYQAVNQSGACVRMTVSAEQSTGKADREFYTVDGSDGARWYLVRITQ